MSWMNVAAFAVTWVASLLTAYHFGFTSGWSVGYTLAGKSAVDQINTHRRGDN